MTEYGVLPDEIDASIREVPDECPICHRSIEPIFVTYYPDRADAVYNDGFQIVFACPRGACKSAFIAYYDLHGGVQSFGGCLPMEPKTPDIPELVAGVSSRFVDTYTQAEAAHSFNLDEVAGGGYRKALEVLVKDFLIGMKPEDEDAVIKMSLHSAIRALPDEVTSNLAHYTKLLGNDETHFFRKLSGKDIDDVRTYLDATITALKLYLMAEASKEVDLPMFGTKK